MSFFFRTLPGCHTSVICDAALVLCLTQTPRLAHSFLISSAALSTTCRVFLQNVPLEICLRISSWPGWAMGSGGHGHKVSFSSGLGEGTSPGPHSSCPFTTKVQVAGDCWHAVPWLTWRLFSALLVLFFQDNEGLLPPLEWQGSYRLTLVATLILGLLDPAPLQINSLPGPHFRGPGRETGSSHLLGHSSNTHNN